MTVDADLLALLEAVPNLNVHDGSVDVDEAEKVIRVPLPYVVFISSPGFDINERYDGRAGNRAVDFQLKGVGLTRAQAKAVLDRARDAINRKRLNGNLIKRSDDNAFVRREDVYTDPGGAPLFYGVDQYNVATTA